MATYPYGITSINVNRPELPETLGEIIDINHEGQAFNRQHGNIEG